jgi:tetratricopeptide (TPR) repeat protein
VKKLSILIMTLMLMILYGCASTKYIFKEPELQETLAGRLPPGEMETLEIPFHSTPEMQAYAKSIVKNEKEVRYKATRLADAIVATWKLDVSYDRVADYTASQVFHETRRANCLSFTHLFISLARAVGLRAYYVDVEHDELLADTNMVVSNRHICAGISDGGKFYLLDFDSSPRKSYKFYQIIDDLEAVANHYNNLAINRFSQNESSLQEALTLLNTSLRIKPDFSRALNNRGVLQNLAVDSTSAEKSFRAALKGDPGMHEAHSNLSGMLMRQGALDEALDHARQALRSRPNNQSYQLRVAMIHFYLTDYMGAFREFRKITRNNPSNSAAFYGLALSAYHLGRLDPAFNAITKALELNPVNREFEYLQSMIALKKAAS